jgi:hypothetical protein
MKSLRNKIKRLLIVKKSGDELTQNFENNLKIYWERYPEKYQKFQDLMAEFFPDKPDGDYDFSSLTPDQREQIVALFDEWGMPIIDNKPARAGESENGSVE